MKVEDDRETTNDTRDKEYSSIADEETDKVEPFPFYISTPKKILSCEECLDKSECVDCLVNHMLGKHEVARRSWPFYGGQTPFYKSADHNNSSYTLL